MGAATLKEVQENVTVVKTSKYRKLLSLLIQSSPEIQDLSEWDKNGFLTFSIKAKDIGLTDIDYSIYANEIFSYYIIDFLGELIIREHMPIFVSKIKELDVNDYMEAMQTEEHGHIGMESNKNNLLFTFHVSLLRNFLVESFKHL